MSTLMFSNSHQNPDENFVLHGKTVPPWKRSGSLKNSMLTNATGNLIQHTLYSTDNYRAKKKGKKYSNFECSSNEVDKSLTKSVRFINDSVDDNENQLVLSKSHKNSNPRYGGKEPEESEHSLELNKDFPEDKALSMYENPVSVSDDLCGMVVSPRDAQWYVNPNHLKEYGETPTLQSVGYTHRYGEKSKHVYSDKDKVALNYFPVTLGSAYMPSAAGFPDTGPLRLSVPPSMRKARSKSVRLTRADLYSLRSIDRFDTSPHVDKLYWMSSEAPAIGSASVYLTSPHQVLLAKLRLERLKLEEAKLLELKQLEEIEHNTELNWRESTALEFYNGAQNSSQLTCSTLPRYQDMLDYRNDLLRSSLNSLKQCNTRKQLTAAY